MLETILAFLSANQNLWGFLVLMLGAGVEYVFPPFPGDTVMLLGGVLVAAGGWSPVFVFTAVTLGAVAGFMVDYSLGRWLLRNPKSWLSKKLGSGDAEGGVERVLSGFRRFGAVFLIANRFLPGVRAFFFIAAGMADIPPWKVMLYGGLSAAAWNILIIVAGYAVGGSLDELQALFSQYTTVAWSVVGLVVLAWLGWRLFKWRQDTKKDTPE